MPRNRRSAPSKLVHPVSSFYPQRRSTRIAAQRDLGATLELVSALQEQGFALGDMIFNFPPQQRVRNHFTEPLHQVDLAFAKEGDALLHATRPPLDDRLKGGKRRMSESYTDLELTMLKHWKKYIARCARSEVMLNEDLHALLQEPYADRRHMTFRLSEGAPYKTLNDCVSGREATTNAASERRTAVFLLRIDAFKPGGPGFIGAFGMDSTATLVWAYRLRHDLRELLAAPGFVMAELTNTGLPARPDNMKWALDWGVRILLREQPR